MKNDTIAAGVTVGHLGLCMPDAGPARFTLSAAGNQTERWASDITAPTGECVLRVRGLMSNRNVWLATNAAALRQGHNTISSSDVPMLCYAAVQSANKELGLGFTAKHGARFARGHGMELTHITTPVHLAKPSGLPTAAVVNGIALAGLIARSRVSFYVDEIGYFDQQSQRVALKFRYPEARLASKIKLPAPQTSNIERMWKFARDTFWFEPVFLQRWLKAYFGDGRPLHPALFTPDVLAGMIRVFLDKYDLSRDIRQPLTPEQLGSIAPQWRPWLMHWQRGVSAWAMQQGDPDEHRRAQRYLWKYHGIDIYRPPPTQLAERVELGDILHPDNFVPVPDFLKQDPKLFFNLDMHAIREQIDVQLAKSAGARAVGSPAAPLC